MSQPKLTLRPPPHREFIQGFPGIVGAGPRPPAHVAGTVEVRLGTKGLKAAWLRIELRKLETLPGGESWGELIGKGPIDIWSARKDEAYKSESEKGWELLQTADFPFQVTIPEGLPPSAKLEKNAGINYELVTSLCVRSKKGLLKKETTSSIIQNTHPLWLDKHELHSTWPVYVQPEDHEAIQDDIRVKVMRNRSGYGPGDSVDVRVIVSSERVSPIKVKNISFSIRETITFKGSAKKTFGSNKAASQKTETLSSKSKSFGKKVYKGDMHTFDLSCQIPRTHTLVTIQTAKHIEVSYTLRVQVETAKKPIIVDHLPITVSNFTKTASDALMDRIGWVPGLSAPADPARTPTSSTRKAAAMWPFTSSSSSSSSAPASADKCPVDEETRLAWLKANPGKSSPFQPDSSPTAQPTAGPSRPRYNDETRLSTEREISSIPRSYSPLSNPTAAQAAQPAPSTPAGPDDGEDQEGKWVYPSPKQLYNAMKRKNQNPQVADMDVVVPIHNAVNEQAWRQILAWERMWTGKPEGNQDTKLVSFKGRPKDLTWRAWLNTLAGYQRPFDRHDWTIERNGSGEQVRYVIDFYTGKSNTSSSSADSAGGEERIADKFGAAAQARNGLSFYLDVRPAPSTVEGLAMRSTRMWNKWFGPPGSAPH